jgi:hypothetical protein
MTAAFAQGTQAPPIFDIIESISDFVCHQQAARHTSGRVSAATLFAGDGKALIGEMPGRVFAASSHGNDNDRSFFDHSGIDRFASAYSRSEAAKRSEKYRRAVCLLALICL